MSYEPTNEHYYYNDIPKKNNSKNILLILFASLFIIFTFASFGVNMYYLIRLSNNMNTITNYINYFMSDRSQVEHTATQLSKLIGYACKWAGC